MNVLFLCTGNSCRSILAEATFNALAPAGLRAMSAGSQPAGYVHPRSLALLAREGITTDGLHSKSWNDLPREPNLVVTVCASAAGETCPVYLGKVARAHWGVDDPAQATGTEAEIDTAFEHAYRVLRIRIEAFLALPGDLAARDPAAFQAEVGRIGRLGSSISRSNPAESAIMKSIQVFDPALCCSSGVCGVEVDQQLVTFAADVEWAKQQGMAVERFNLAQQPLVFAQNAVVKGFLERSGAESLPLILIDGEVALAGRYPTREELARWAGVKAAPLAQTASGCSSGGRCC